MISTSSSDHTAENSLASSAITSTLIVGRAESKRTNSSSRLTSEVNLYIPGSFGLYSPPNAESFSHDSGSFITEYPSRSRPVFSSISLIEGFSSPDRSFLTSSFCSSVIKSMLSLVIDFSTVLEVDISSEADSVSGSASSLITLEDAYSIAISVSSTSMTSLADAFSTTFKFASSSSSISASASQANAYMTFGRLSFDSGVPNSTA